MSNVAIHAYADVEIPEGVITIDGITFNAETGEILHKEFQITDDASADWALEKIMNAEVRKAALEIKRRALLENLDAQIKEEQRRIDGLHFRFDNELTNYAKGKLNGKTKTVKFTYGSVSFRTVKGGLRVVDAANALSWAKAKGFDHAIKLTESFQISQLTDLEREIAMDDIEAEGIPASVMPFEVKPDAEAVTIKTGVTP